MPFVSERALQQLSLLLSSIAGRPPGPEGIEQPLSLQTCLDVLSVWTSRRAAVRASHAAVSRSFARFPPLQSWSCLVFFVARMPNSDNEQLDTRILVHARRRYNRLTPESLILLWDLAESCINHAVQHEMIHLCFLSGMACWPKESWSASQASRAEQRLRLINQSSLSIGIIEEMELGGYQSDGVSLHYPAGIPAPPQARDHSGCYPACVASPARACAL
jgi:hypothetical protein